MTHPATNTLVETPSYKGNDPQKWKYIGLWDSNYWLKDNYEEIKYNGEMIPQYDLVCGKGIIALDNLTGGGFAVCSSSVKIKINCIRRIYESDNESEPAILDNEEANVNEAPPKEETLLYSEIFEVKQGELFSQKYNICFLISLFTGEFDYLKEYDNEFPLRNYKNYVYTDKLYTHLKKYINDYKNNVISSDEEEIFDINLHDLCFFRLQHEYGWDFESNLNKYLSVSNSFIMEYDNISQDVFRLSNLNAVKCHNYVRLHTTPYNSKEGVYTGVNVYTKNNGTVIDCDVNYEKYLTALDYYNNQDYRSEAEINHDGKHYNYIKEARSYYFGLVKNSKLDYSYLFDQFPKMIYNFPKTTEDYIYNVEQDNLSEIFAAYGNLTSLVENDEMFAPLRDYVNMPPEVIPVSKMIQYEYWNGNSLINVFANEKGNDVYNTSLTDDIKKKFNELRPTEDEKYDIKVTRYKSRKIEWDVWGLDNDGKGEPHGTIYEGTLHRGLLWKDLPSIVENGKTIKRCLIPSDYNNIKQMAFIRYNENDIYDPDPLTGNPSGGFPYIRSMPEVQWIRISGENVVNFEQSLSQYCAGPPAGTILYTFGIHYIDRAYIPIGDVTTNNVVITNDSYKFYDYDVRKENISYFTAPYESTKDCIYFNWSIKDLVDYNLTRYTQLNFMKELEDFMNNEINIKFTAKENKEINIYFNISIVEES